MNEQPVGHTPTPWKVVGQLRDRIAPDLPKAAALAVTLCEDGTYSQEEYQANAAFIVRACNAHYALVDALRAAQCYIEYVQRHGTTRGLGAVPPLKQINDVLAQVTVFAPERGEGG